MQTKTNEKWFLSEQFAKESWKIPNCFLQIEDEGLEDECCEKEWG